jgi:Ca-activated chloride channel family protein
VQLRWEDPDTGKVSEINGNFNTFDLAARYEDTDPRYQLTATVAQYAEILRRSPYARDTTLRQLRSYADDAARALRDDPDAQEFADLVARAASLR